MTLRTVALGVLLLGCSGRARLTMVGDAMPCVDGAGVTRGTYALYCDDGQTTCSYLVGSVVVASCDGPSDSASCMSAAVTASNACIVGVSADAGAGHDGGIAHGMTCGDITLGAVVPAACLPRCARSTYAAFQACGTDSSCQQIALSADTTAPALANVEGTQTPMNCSQCPSVQALSCERDACPTQFAPCADCVRSGGSSCDPSALAQCAAMSTALRSCVTAREAACFGM